MYPLQESGGDDLIFLGRIHPDKGVHLAIEVARLSGRHLIIAGIIQDEVYYRNQVKPHIDDQNISYIGPVGMAEKNKLFASACTLIHLNTIPERFGLVLAEANAAGVPVIAMDLGSCREVRRIHTHWIKPRYDFFLPVEVLSAVFRGKFHEALKRAFHDGKLNFHGDLKLLAQPKTFAAWLRPLFRKDWVVYAKRPFGGPEHVLRYLGRYTHRVAISNHRLVSFTDGEVTFRWRDSAHNNEQRSLPLSVDEFLRRFLLHLLPEGFVRIRNFGFLANRKRATNLPLCFQLLGAAPQTEQAAASARPSDLWSCPKCGGPMTVVERLTAAEIQLRSPPVLTAAA